MRQTQGWYCRGRPKVSAAEGRGRPKVSTVRADPRLVLLRGGQTLCTAGLDVSTAGSKVCTAIARPKVTTGEGGAD